MSDSGRQIEGVGAEVLRLPRQCFLRQTFVKLADGRAYSFRALPFSRKTTPILERLLDEGVADAAKLGAVLDAVELSLSYDYTPEEVEAILDAGLVVPSNMEILNAMIAGLS